MEQSVGRATNEVCVLLFFLCNDRMKYDDMICYGKYTKLGEATFFNTNRRKLYKFDLIYIHLRI